MQNCFMKACKLIGYQLRKLIDSVHWTSSDLPVLTQICNSINSLHFYFHQFLVVSSQFFFCLFFISYFLYSKDSKKNKNECFIG